MDKSNPPGLEIQKRRLRALRRRARVTVLASLCAVGAVPGVIAGYLTEHGHPYAFTLVAVAVGTLAAVAFLYATVLYDNRCVRIPEQRRPVRQVLKETTSHLPSLLGLKIQKSSS